MMRGAVPAMLGLWLVSASSVCAQSAASVEEQRRAGWPQEVARWAKPSDNGRYVGNLVGGGAWNWRRAEPALPDEGTWGWDYLGGPIRRRVILGWWHGRRDQGGVGAYQTDGPRLLPPLHEKH